MSYVSLKRVTYSAVEYSSAYRTVSGATAGVLAGGVVGALTSAGFSKEEAREYEKSIQAGGIMLIVPAREKLVSEANDILKKHGATDIKEFDLFATPARTTTANA